MHEKHASKSQNRKSKIAANSENAESPHVVSVQISGKHDFSKFPTDAINLIENFGVEGDAHAGTTDQHVFHIKRFRKHSNLRQVHFIQTELFDAVSELGHVVRPGGWARILPQGTLIFLACQRAPV